MNEVSRSELWSEYVAAYKCLIEARMRVQACSNDLAAEIANSLVRPGLECSAALEFLEYGAEDVAISVLPQIIAVALIVHGQTAKARKLLVALPSVAVVSAVADAERDVRARKDYESFACLIELWRCLGYRDRALALAATAAADPDEDVRDVGLSNLQRMETE